MPRVLDAAQTASALPAVELAREIEALLTDATVQVPQRLVQPLPGGGSLFVMPALDSRIAIIKLITFTPANAGRRRPAIQGDVVVFDAATGERLLVLDGPTVTAQRTAAVSLLAAQRLAPNPDGPLLVVGAGVQGRSHLEAFAQGLRVREVHVVSRTRASAQSLVDHARALGLRADVADDALALLAHCPLVVACTPASEVALEGRVRHDAFVAAVGAFTPAMLEVAPALCLDIVGRGCVVLDTADARHEAGDLLQAGLRVEAMPTLRDVVAGRVRSAGPVLFKSCGWAGWDLAAARCATRA